MMMLNLPKRTSLAFQVAESIREGINKQVWNGFLPGERHLTQVLHVSRPTISDAIHILAKDGLITVRHGCRTRIAKRGQSASQISKPLVAIVTHEPLAQMASSSSNRIGEMRTHLAEHGFTTEIFVCQGRSVAAQLRSLKGFLHQSNVFCLLISLRRELQQWFATHSIPALVLGSCHTSVRLPSFGVDYQAVCRHAAGVFVSKGHRCMAFVVSETGGAGEVASEKGFLEVAAQQLESGRVHTLIVRHDGTAKNLCAKLDMLFNSSRPPTALLVAKPLHVMIVIIYLLKRGLKVPDSVSLIARDQDNLFVSVNPTISHYRIADDTFNNRLARLMFKLVNHGGLKPKSHLIFPRFFAGNTLKKLS